MGKVIYLSNDNLCDDCVFRKGKYCVNDEYIKHYSDLSEKRYCKYKVVKKGIFNKIFKA